MRVSADVMRTPRQALTPIFAGQLRSARDGSALTSGTWWPMRPASIRSQIVSVSGSGENARTSGPWPMVWRCTANSAFAVCEPRHCQGSLRRSSGVPYPARLAVWGARWSAPAAGV
jgi:hypothetical protein